MTAGLRSSRWRRLITLLATAVTVGILAVWMTSYPGGAQAQDAPVGLGTAADFSVLAGSTVTNTGDTLLEQDLGVHPGSAATGFPPGVVEGDIHLQTRSPNRRSWTSRPPTMTQPRAPRSSTWTTK
jgi:hypothetical protein